MRTALAAGNAVADGGTRIFSLVTGSLALARPARRVPERRPRASQPRCRRKEGQRAAPGPAGPLRTARASRRSSKTQPRSIWHAQPILVSGASAYRKGEFLYQGYLYDDHGAKEVTDPNNPMHSPGGDSSGGDLFSAPDGTYDYPTGPGYDENAADLSSCASSRSTQATAFRITLNTLENPDLVATAIAIGGTEGETHPFPFGANVSAPAQYFLTVHGETAVLTDAATRRGRCPAPRRA